MADTKEGDEESMNASDASIETQTKLIDVIQTIEKYKYMPKSRHEMGSHFGGRGVGLLSRSDDCITARIAT